MASKNCETWVEACKSFGDGHVGEEHKFFDHKVSIDVFVLGDVCGVLAFVVEFKFQLGSCQSQGAVVVATLPENSRDAEQAAEAFCEVGLIVLIVNHVLGLVICERRSRLDARLSKPSVDALKRIVINLPDHRERHSVDL